MDPLLGVTGIGGDRQVAWQAQKGQVLMHTFSRRLLHAGVRSCGFGVLVALLGLLPASRALAQGFLESLPQDTFICVQVSNMKGLLEKIQASPIYRLKDHESLKDTIVQLEAGVDQALSQAKEELGFDPMDLLGSFEGEVIVAVGGLSSVASQLGGALSTGDVPDVPPESIPFLIAGDAGASGEKVRGYLEKVFSFAEKEGSTRKVYSTGKGKITVLRDKTMDQGQGENPNAAGDSPLALYVGEVDSRFYFSMSRPYMESVMAGGGEANLVSSPLFQESRKSVVGGDVLAYVNLKELTTSVGSALSATFFAFYWQKIESLVFGKSLNNMLLSFKLEEKGIRQSFFVHNSGASDGLLALIKGPEFSTSPPKWVSDDVQAYSAMAFNASQLGSTISEIGKLALSFSNPGADIDTLTEGALGVKLTDLMKSFGGKMYYAGGVAQLENPLAGNSYVFELADSGPMKQVLERFSAPGQPMQKTSEEGDDIYTMMTPMGEIAATISDGSFVVSGGKSGVTKFLAGGDSAGDSLASSSTFEKLTSALVPAKVSFLSYTATEYMSTYMKSLAGTLGGAAGPEAQQFLPALMALGETLGSSVGYGVWTEAGLRGESLTLYR